jgi:hypothetical protein
MLCEPAQQGRVAEGRLMDADGTARTFLSPGWSLSRPAARPGQGRPAGRSLPPEHRRCGPACSHRCDRRRSRTSGLDVLRHALVAIRSRGCGRSGPRSRRWKHVLGSDSTTTSPDGAVVGYLAGSATSCDVRPGCPTGPDITSSGADLGTNRPARARQRPVDSAA